ncbi:hypothetical protein BDN70DRAFT_871264 [Pholiota conissans]|uniref:2'-phosphotransferase n=1 Tax=Pholiota conissans TaxID=109636 RepID=A0A9P5ZFQ0_9AGAR|nr:hypothetical protein BDN70DRAFT_871264 [Pholiota conissans]
MSSSIPSDKLSSISVADQAATVSTSSSAIASSSSKPSSNQGQVRRDKKPQTKAYPNSNAPQGGSNTRKPGPKPNPSSSTKLRGMEKDSPDVRVSKTLSWLLRHGAQGEGLAMRSDGYVKVVDLLNHPKLHAQGLDLERIKDIVRADSKQRYDLILESAAGVKLEVFGARAVTPPSQAGPSVSVPSETTTTTTVKDGIWWIKARQGHSIKTVKLELRPILSVSDIPTGMAVHGTNPEAWKSIAKTGLSKMKRNHIHLAQNVAGSGVISGMRTSSKVLIYVDVQKAIDAGIKFWFSENGVVLTEGDEKGFLLTRFFEKVVDSNESEITGWMKE